MTNFNRKEQRQAKKDGAKVVSNSGRGFVKGDAMWKDYLVDYKHNAKTFTLSNVNWQKHAADSWKEDHRIPMVKVIFEDGTELAIIPWDMLVKLEEKYDEPS